MLSIIRVFRTASPGSPQDAPSKTPVQHEKRVHCFPTESALCVAPSPGQELMKERMTKELETREGQDRSRTQHKLS